MEILECAQSVHNVVEVCTVCTGVHKGAQANCGVHTVLTEHTNGGNTLKVYTVRTKCAQNSKRVHTVCTVRAKLANKFAGRDLLAN